MRRPLLAIALSLAILAPLTISATAIQTGLTLLPQVQATEAPAAALPTLEQRALEIATRMLSVVEIVVDGERTPQLDRQIDELVTSIGEAPAFSPVVIVQWNAANDLAVISLLIASDPDSSEVLQQVRVLREETIPSVFAPAPANITLGGVPAAKLDTLHVIEQWQWRIAGIVMAMCFVLLLLTFRSIAIPVKAIAMNLLSTGAALGAMVLVFQKGYASGVLGIEQTSSIEAWVPLMLFSVLFGISTDYHLFLLSRVRSSTAHRATTAHRWRAACRPPGGS